MPAFQGLARGKDQGTQDGQFARRQVGAAQGTAQRQLGRVHLQSLDGSALLGLQPFAQGSYAGHQLARVHRLGEVEVGATFIAQHPVANLSACSGNNDARRGVRLAQSSGQA